MPASYAHYRFGKLVLQKLPADIRQCIQRFRRLYDVGLHGPDLFFYYNPLMQTAVGGLGKAFHAQTGQEFFTRACAQAGTEASRAYLYGLLAHYCLDSACHPYVHKKEDSGEARHVELESEFERFLLEKDGMLLPDGQALSRHMKLTRGECVTAAAFFPPATAANLHLCIGNMARITRFLTGKKRKRVEKLLAMTKNIAIMDQLMPEAADERFAVMDKGLLTYYDRALERYPQLVAQLTAHMRTGEPLGEDFAATFG